MDTALELLRRHPRLADAALAAALAVLAVLTGLLLVAPSPSCPLRPPPSWSPGRCCWRRRWSSAGGSR